MAIKLIALDLDGTLIRKDLTISKANRDAIRWATQQNIDVVVATGRCMGIVPPDVFALPDIRYLITSDGAVTSDKRRGVISRQLIPEQALHELLQITRDTDELIEFFIEGQSHVQRKYYDEIENAHRAGQKSYYYRYHRVPEDDVRAFAKACASHIELMCVHYGRGFDPRDKIALNDRIKQIPGLEVTTSLPNDLEIVGEKAGKGLSLMRLADNLGYNIDEIMAIGDSRNDLDMIKRAGIGVAMGNAHDDVKSQADFVTKSNREDGVAHAIYEIVNREK